MEIEDDAKNQSSEVYQVARLAIIQSSLHANEEVEAKPIKTRIKAIFRFGKNPQEQTQEFLKRLDVEIFLTNFRILFIILNKQELFERRSIYFNIDTDINIEQLQLKRSSCTIISFKQMGLVQYKFYIDQLLELDKQKIENFIQSKVSIIYPASHTEKFQEMILKQDEKLSKLYEKVVENQKILSKEQFWELNEDYQNLIKYQERDEKTIRRSYIQSLIPELNMNQERYITVDALDQEYLQFDLFSEQLYDPNKLIEAQNNKTFQNYEQEVLMSGKIDKKITELSKKEQAEEGKVTQTELLTHEETQQNNIVEIEEDISLDQMFDFDEIKKEKEISKQEYQANLIQNPSEVQQNDFCNILKQIESSPLKQEQIQFNPNEKIKQSYETSWYQSADLLEQSKPKTNLSQSENNSVRQCMEMYSNTVYQMRQILKWIYKEKQLGEKCRTEIFEKLKNELEKIRKSTPNLENLDKDQVESIQGLFNDLNSQFIYKE